MESRRDQIIKLAHKMRLVSISATTPEQAQVAKVYRKLYIKRVEQIIKGEIK